MIRLNLGCGNDYVEGYTNIDIDKTFCTNGLDLEADMKQLPYEANSVDEIRAEGCIEHLSYRDIIPTLIHWFCILKPNGNLVIETPNMTRIASDILKENGFPFTHAFETLYGGQRNPTEHHFALYNENSLMGLLVMAGFYDVRTETPTKNLGKGEDWNIRLIATKFYDYSFPGLSKELEECLCTDCKPEAYQSEELLTGTG